MKRFRVIVEVSARQDIEEAYLWLADQSANAAYLWLNDLYQAMERLEFFPERCPLAPETQFFDTRIREIFHGRRQHKYRILFTVKEAEVRILHVRHGARRTLGESGAPDT